MFLPNATHDLISYENHLLHEVIHGVENVELNVFIYNESSYLEKKCSTLIEILPIIQNNISTKCVWIEVIGSSEQRKDIVQQLGVYFNLHMLTLENIQTVTDRAKLDLFDDGIYLLMKMIYIYEHNHMNIQQQQINFYLKNNLLITFQEKHTPLFFLIKQRLANNRGRLTKFKADYLFYCLLDIIIENYMIVLDLIGFKIEKIEAELMQMKWLKLDTLKLIHQIKHDILRFRSICSPLKDIIIKLQKAYDQLPRTVPFEMQKRCLRLFKKKRGWRIRQQMYVSVLQPITSRKQSIALKWNYILQSKKARSRSVSPTQTNILQSRKSRARSASPTLTHVVTKRKSRQSLSTDGVTILHEYSFMCLRNLQLHILHINNTLETYTEIIFWLAKFYMALNEITVQQAIKLLVTLQAFHFPNLLIHGLNSMNFDWVPQRDGYYNSYFIFLAGMALVIFFELTIMKVKKWI